MKLIDAAKRIKGSSVVWSELQSRVPITDTAKFINFKAKTSKYLNNLRTLPIEPPAIDWENYKKQLGAEAKWVDEIRTNYECFEVPFPDENLTKILIEERVKTEADITEFKTKSNSNIATYESEVKRINSIIAFEEMTMEDFIDSYPNEAPNFINKPTFWPHNPEEQPNSLPKPTTH